jgi:hypothetical protein
VIIIILIIVLVGGYSCLRRVRARGGSPKYLPGSYLKRRWEAWTPRSKYSSIQRRNGSTDLSSENTAYRGAEVEERAATQAAAAGVDRNTSVRSVMTLPAYSQSPKDTEQVIGREGEREGMDTVVEYPENPDEEESRREEQMESLYQIRLARRREIAEREERRRERREARDRGDFTRLEELRRDSRQRASQSNESVNGGLTASAATLIAEHQSRGRERRVSAVSYADVGQVRHDGTRIRANSNESERGGLLDGAAPMGENDEGRPRGSSESRSLAEPRPHFRNRSASSALSISTNASDLERPAFTPAGSDRPRTSGSNNTSESSPTANRFTPEDSGSGEGEDIGESRIPANITITTTDLDSPSQPRPPQYEHLDWGDAPAYTEEEVRRRQSQRLSQIRTQEERTSGAPQLPELSLPSISVEGATEPSTPVTPARENAAGEGRAS